jgi:hypothetical protein
MRDSPIFTEQLRDKALLALEDAIQECRYRAPRPSFAVRFALAYLWVYSGSGDRSQFDRLWRSMREGKASWRFSAADHALNGIYRTLRVERPDKVESQMWHRWTEHEGHGGGFRDR